jgi:drug/metabolite transporter, DME family
MLPGLLLIALAAASWGTTGATMTIAARETGIGPLLVGWARLAVAAPCLMLMAAVAARRTAAGAARPSSALPRSPRDLAAYAVLGGAMAAYQVCYFRAVTLTGVAVTALLAICSAPLLIAALAALALGERIAPPVRLSLALAVTGTALLVVGPRGLGELSPRFGGGAALALGAGLAYAVFAVTAKRLLVRTPPLSLAAASFALAAVMLAPALATQPSPAADLARAAPLLLYLGVGPTALAYALFTVGLRRVPATAASIATLIEPLTASALGVWLFGESLGAAGWAGAALLLAGLATLARSGAAARGG